jgi:hypothetical protein
LTNVEKNSIEILEKIVCQIQQSQQTALLGDVVFQPHREEQNCPHIRGNGGNNHERMVEIEPGTDAEIDALHMILVETIAVIHLVHNKGERKINTPPPREEYFTHGRIR